MLVGVVLGSAPEPDVTVGSSGEGLSGFLSPLIGTTVGILGSGTGTATAPVGTFARALAAVA